jgi:type I restriction enzyme M protein
MFTGVEFDATMLRIGAMNLQLHGIESPQLIGKDALSEANEDQTNLYSLILANPPFKGSLDYDVVESSLLSVTKTKKTELLFISLILRMLKVGGRAAVIVPDGVLFGSSKAHKELRKTLVEYQKLEAIISMPSGVFKPYAGVSTAVMVFTKTNSGGTDQVWFYDMQADGFSLDDKRTPLLSKNETVEEEIESALGLGIAAEERVPYGQKSTEEAHAKNNIPDIQNRWQNRDKEAERARTEQSFLVPKSEIAGNDYDLSINRYKEIVYEEMKYAAPMDIIAEIKDLDKQRADALNALEGLLG